MDTMKTKLEALHQLDLARIQAQNKQIRLLQKQGKYPLQFDFPLLLQLELTRRCNVFCKHCYNNSGGSVQVEDAMTPEKWIAFCRYIIEHGGIFECILSGGEPLLLGDNLFRIMDILHEDGTNFLLITNGFLLNKETVHKLEKYRYKWIQVSIDGATPEYHDAFRQRAGSWDKAVQGAFMVSESGLPLTIAHSVSPQNLSSVDKMCDLAYSLGAGNLILSAISLSGRTYNNNDLLLNNQEKEALLQAIERNAQKYYGKMMIQRSLDEDLQYAQVTDIPNAGLIIRPDGSIRLDCMAPFSIGNILKDDFQTVWNTKGKNCWKHPMVQAYISGEKNTIKNYVDEDMEL